ncbi:MAG: chemotaxis protein CheW [Verrucomicrobiota bacterium]
MGLALPLSREAGAIRQLVVFELDGQRYALRLDVVERVLRTAEIRPLPGAPEVVLGLVNLEGQVIPVFDPRRRFGLPPREVQLSDVLIIARTRRLTVALAADATGGVLAREGTPPRPPARSCPARVISRAS